MGSNTENGVVPTTNGDISHSISDETTICSLCSENFKSPKVLSCLHSFCSGCIEEHIGKALSQNGQKYFACPSCDLDIDIPAGSLQGQYANAFPDDTFMSKLVELQDAMKEGKACDICTRTDETVSAVNWCMDCYDALCETCYKVHVHGKTTANHIVICIAEMRKMPLENIMKQKSKVPCLKHSELITLYCVDCRDPLCVQCMAVSHRRCENVITVADALSSRSDVHDVMLRLQKLQTSIGESNGMGETDDVLEDSIETSRKQIVELCNDLCEKIRAQQATLLMDLEHQAQHGRTTVKEKSEPRKIGAKSIKAANDRMQTLVRYGSDVEILLAYNQVRKQLDSCQGNLNNADVKPVSVKVEFVVDETVRKFTEEFDKLGTVSTDVDDGDEGLGAWGVTCTSADDIIVTDCKNKRIQKFSKFGDLVDYVQLEDEPRDITTCGNRDDVAITIIGKLIIFLSTKKTMQLIKRTKTEKQYDAISYSERDVYLVVSSIREKTVDIIQLDGTILRSYGEDPENNLVFHEPRFVCASPDRTIIVSDVGKNTVICLDHSGRVIFKYRPEDQKSPKKPQGVCVDKVGNLFLADEGNNRVQLLTSDGVFQRHVLGSESGLERPVAIRVSGSNRMIIVQSDGMVKVFSYS